MIVVIDEDGEFLGVYDCTEEAVREEYANYLKYYSDNAEKIEDGEIETTSFREFLHDKGIKMSSYSVVDLNNMD